MSKISVLKLQFLMCQQKECTLSVELRCLRPHTCPWTLWLFHWGVEEEKLLVLLIKKNHQVTCENVLVTLCCVALASLGRVFCMYRWYQKSSGSNQGKEVWASGTKPILSIKCFFTNVDIGLSHAINSIIFNSFVSSSFFFLPFFPPRNIFDGNFQMRQNVNQFSKDVQNSSAGNVAYLQSI